MHRKEFLTKCGLGCLAFIGFDTALSGCVISRSASGDISADKVLKVSLDLFVKGKQPGSFARYLVIRNAALNYPIVIYRESSSAYTALLLRCTHQYAELNVSGELVSCSAHGSEFNSKGEVVQGPATAALRQFQTHSDEQNLYIQLA